MNREQRKADLLRFLHTIQRPDRPLAPINEQDGLVESGLVDSLALLQIVTYLEETYQIDFRETGVLPSELSSIGAILDLIEQEETSGA